MRQKIGTKILLHQPFHVTGFAAAVEGALIVGVVSWLIHLILDNVLREAG